MIIKAIDTKYKGYLFRSRLEARWAVFFDELGIEWHYEPEGYQLPSGWYLPDFWLPQVKMFAEVKPEQFSASELTLCCQLANSNVKPWKPHESRVLLLDGVPSDRPYLAISVVDFNHGCWDVFTSWHDLAEGHSHWKSEGRFYWCCSGPAFEAGCNHEFPIFDAKAAMDFSVAKDNGEIQSYYLGCLAKPAIEAARSARFEHGASPRAGRQSSEMTAEQAANMFIQHGASSRTGRGSGSR